MNRAVLARVTVFLAGFLIVLAEPMIARMVLPILGGSAQVWTTCVLFFQLVVLLGYAYAFASARALPGRAQVIGHACLTAAGLLCMPVHLDHTIRAPTGSWPVVWLIARLTEALGLPMLALAGTGPLVAHWIAQDDSGGLDDPYTLYAPSNGGSLAALIAYPILIEPRLGLVAQARMLAWTYVAFLVLIALQINGLPRRKGTRHAPAPASPPERPMSADGEIEALTPATISPGSPEPHDKARPRPRPRPWALRARWIVLSLVPASLMLGVTAHMTSEVPSIALLWLLPLALYLVSLVCVFSRRNPIPGPVVAAILPLLVGIVAIVMFVPLRLAGFSVHLLAFLGIALALHGELAAGRPVARRLPEYYLCVAAGGALGGVFNALVAPLAFPFVAEYPLALVAACALLPGTEPSTHTRLRGSTGPLILMVVLPCVIAILPRAGDERDIVARVAVCFLGAAIAMLWRRRSVPFSIAIAAVLLAGFVAFQGQGTLLMARSFYGVSRVVIEPTTGNHVLYCGTTIHGAQDVRASASGGPIAAPIAYFAPDGPIGRLLAGPAACRVGSRWAVIGLGVGALAWYARPGQTVRFFEIDPVVHAIATDPRCFDFLARSRGSVDVVMGDGRQSMEMEPAGSFDLIVADAFASDAVPVHLLTREALDTYLAKLAPSGLLVFNTSNRHVRLDAVVAALADASGLVARALVSHAPDRTQQAAGKAQATWAVLARSKADLSRWLAGRVPDEPLQADARLKAWTDDYASVWSALTW